MRLRARKGNRGFSLVELTVVVILIGVLAAFGVPRFRDSVERSKAAEAFNFLSAVRSAQERYHALKGQYATSLAQLDIDLSTPTYFRVGRITDGDGRGYEKIQTSWSLTLTRKGPSAGYGNYTVTFTQNGFLKDYRNRRSIAHPSRSSINPMAS